MLERKRQLPLEPIAGWRFDEGQGHTAKEDVRCCFMIKLKGVLG